MTALSPAAAAATLGLVAAAGLAVRLLVPTLADLARQGGLVAVNYRGAPVPVGLGIAPVLAGAGAATLGAALGLWPAVAALAAALLWLAAALAGLIDDVLGGGGPRGMAAHLKLAAAGRISSGLFKAGVIGAAALAAAALLGSRSAALVVDALLIALAANALNLLDTRPGRAGKAFLAAAAPALAAAGAAGALLWPLVAALLVYLPGDLREQAMLGDAGANPLGAAAGLAWVLLLPPWGRALGLAGLVALHLVAGRVSLSAAIAARPWLRALDAVGRRRL